MCTSFCYTTEYAVNMKPNKVLSRTISRLNKRFKTEGFKLIVKYINVMSLASLVCFYSRNNSGRHIKDL